MRRLERSRRVAIAAIGFAALVAVGGCGGSDEPVEVTGSSECPHIIDGTEVGDELPSESGTATGRTEGYTAYCTDTMDDARVTGDSKVVLDIDFVFDGEQTVGTFEGTSTLEGPDGTWEGDVTGTTTWPRGSNDHRHEVDVVYTGTGGYEGLRYTCHLVGTGFPWDVTGTIEPIG